MNEQALKDRIQELEEAFGAGESATAPIRRAFRLDNQDAQALSLLLRRNFVGRQGLYTVLYGALPESEWPNEKILDTLICRVRAALKRCGLPDAVQTKWGDGWSISRSDRAKIKALIDGPALAIA